MFDYFLRPYLVLLLLLVAPIVYGWAKRQITIRHPSLEPQKGLRSRSLIILLAAVCLGGMTVALDLALMGPKVPNAVVEHKALIRKVCISIDRSGSMDTELQDGAKDLSEDESKAGKDAFNNGADKLTISEPSAEKSDEPKKMKRIEGAELAARYIIRHRMSDNPDETDQFCLMTFDDDTYMMAPLTNDKRVLLLRSKHISENTGGGTNFAGPYGYTTGTGPLQKAIDYFAVNTGPGSVAVLILVTDGEDSIPDERRKQLLESFKQARIHFYVIGVGDSWKNSENLDLQKFADEIHASDSNNGHVFKAANPGEMQKAMAKINELERAQEVIESRQEYREIYGYFLSAALAFGAIFLALAALSRRVP
ncbi:MAG: VWA domain-containing protein [Candidatus Obscuribacterales bacterium]|nr:VWA domain-containing protein [Candidatus Obscuribacterales bacterium]